MAQVAGSGWRRCARTQKQSPRRASVLQRRSLRFHQSRGPPFARRGLVELPSTPRVSQSCRFSAPVIRVLDFPPISTTSSVSGMDSPWSQTREWRRPSRIAESLRLRARPWRSARRLARGKSCGVRLRARSEICVHAFISTTQARTKPSTTLFLRDPIPDQAPTVLWR